MLASWYVAWPHLPFTQCERECVRLSRPRFIEQNKQTRCESLTIYIPHLRYCICDLRTHTYIHIFTYTHMDRISTPTSQLLGRHSCPILQEASELRSGMSQMHISPSRITPARKSLRGHTHNRVPVPIASHVSTTIFSCTREHCLHTKCKYSIRCTMYDVHASPIRNSLVLG